MVSVDEFEDEEARPIKDGNGNGEKNNDDDDDSSSSSESESSSSSSENSSSKPQRRPQSLLHEDNHDSDPFHGTLNSTTTTSTTTTDALGATSAQSRDEERGAWDGPHDDEEGKKILQDLPKTNGAHWWNTLFQNNKTTADPKSHHNNSSGGTWWNSLYSKSNRDITAGDGIRREEDDGHTYNHNQNETDDDFNNYTNYKTMTRKQKWIIILSVAGTGACLVFILVITLAVTLSGRDDDKNQPENSNQNATTPAPSVAPTTSPVVAPSSNPGDDDDDDDDGNPTPPPTKAPSPTSGDDDDDGGDNVPTKSPVAPAPTVPQPDFVTDEALFTLVVNQVWDGGNSLAVENSPQRQSFLWLQDVDVNLITDAQQQQQQQRRRGQQLQLTTGERPKRQLETTIISEAKKLQRYRLMVFYYGSNGPNDWEDPLDFGDENMDECEWDQKVEYDANSTIILHCDDNTNNNTLLLTHLEIQSTTMSGTLVPELGELTTLTHLVIDNTHLSSSDGDGDDNNAVVGLSGGIPATFAKLVNLQLFELQGNTLQGNVADDSEEVIPDTLFSDWASIETLNLARNKIPGPIPSSMEGLSTLRRLNLESNNFTGAIPTDLGNGWNNLERLVLSENDLTGNLPDALSSSITTFKEFRVDGNRLEGNFPDISNWNQMETTLDLSRNTFSGLIGVFTAEWSKLNELFLKNSGFRADFTSSNTFGLEYLSDIYRMDLSGTVEVDDGGTTVVTAAFTGTLPPEICESITAKGPDVAYVYVDCLDGAIEDPANAVSCDETKTVCCPCCQCADSTATAPPPPEQ